MKRVLIERLLRLLKNKLDLDEYFEPEADAWRDDIEPDPLYENEENN